MAITQFNAALGQNDAYGVPKNVTIARTNSISTSAGTLATDVATMVAAAIPVAAALAVLVADGASPTQAHVNTLNSAYTTLATAMTAVGVDQAAITAGVGTSTALSVQVDTTLVTTNNMFQRLLDDIARRVRGSSLLTQ